MHKTTRRFSRLLALSLVLAAMSSIASVASVTAANQSAANGDASGAITQTYNADPTVQTGMLVALNPKDQATVIPLKNGQIKTFLGVVIPTSSAPIVLTPEKIVQQQVLVARTGRYNLLVSSQNGAIKSGDYLTLSAVNGIAMKAGVSQEQVIGKAAGNFSGNTDVISSVALKDSSGHSSNVNIGLIPANINISYNPLFQKPTNYVPGVLAKVAVSIANKQVSVGRIYLSAAVLVIVSFITGTMLYSGVRNGMRAIGRNPLSRKSILKGLLQTTTAGLTIFIAGVFAVYLLLKL